MSSLLKTAFVLLLAAPAALAHNYYSCQDGNNNNGQSRSVPAVVDYIVLGVGTAGSLIASRLVSAENCRYTVLAIDIGTDLTGSDFTNDPGNWLQVKASKVDWNDYFDPAGSHPQLTVDLFKRHITQGRTLGGSSAINSAMFVRGDPEDWNRWAIDNPGWSYNEIVPFFKEMATNTNKFNSNPAYHGNTGPLFITGAVFDSRLQPFIDTAQNVGMSFNPDMNGAFLIDNPVGSITSIDMTIKEINGERIRQNSWHSFLRPLRNRSNLYLRDRSFALKIGFLTLGNFKVARTVEWLDTFTGQKVTTRARKEIVLSLGAIRSSQVLRLSGVGDSAELADLGIPVVHHLPGVGKNLQDHPIATMMMTSPNLPACTGGEPRVDWFFRTDNQPASDPRPDSQVIGAFACNSLFSLVYLSNPYSRGEVVLTSADPTARPVPKLNYFSDPDGHDLKVLSDGMRRTYEYLSAAPISASLIFGPSNFTDYDVLRTYILQGASNVNPRNANTNSGNHMAGTCKMGPVSDPMAVVDNRLRVHGIRNLRVADASIMPTISTGNTQAPAYGIGAKAAAMILEDN